ncbi:CyaA/EF/ExoY family adenylyl cyclase toxin [Vibrio metoecus]|uniref:CyaA/EF/ExoY family adenylyl cyclase toxin n=1 Tax=Vibrio metoecus TaxID=1481663 RepID=UPI00215CB1EC|nr:CyaA/EF/ExoY family adenylyl cyclase toxin [Vibrio metoecus]MCR9388064.1 CyaA/EF/ExoY family adenylyl cyclase toxin [Vibrio metoecus]
MKKEKLLRHSLIFSAMLPLMSALPNIAYGALPVRYFAQNIYYPDAEKYACQVSVDTEFQQDYKIAKGTIISVEVMRYNKELERPYLSKEVYFGVLDDQAGILSFKRDAMTTGDNDPNAQCIVTNVAFPGHVRSELVQQSYDLQSGVALYEQQAVKAGPISNLLMLTDLLSVPFLISLQQDLSADFVDLLPISIGEEDYRLKNTSNVESYAIFVKEVLAGKTGVQGSYNNGLSRNFLEEKTKENIERFLQWSLIEPAIKHGLVSEDIDKFRLAELLRLHILAELEQDSHFEYGSDKQIQASLALQYSPTMTSSMQLLNNADFLNEHLIKEWEYIEEKYDQMSEDALDIGFPVIYSKPDQKGQAVSIRRLKQHGMYLGNYLDITFSDFYDNSFEPLSAYIPKDWTFGISDYYCFIGPNKKVIDGPFRGNLPMFWNSEFSFKPISLVALPPWNFSPPQESLDHELNIHPTDAYLHMQITMRYPDLDGVELAQAVFSSNNPDVSIDIEAGTINNRAVEGGFLGKNFVQIAASVYQKDADDLQDWEILSVKAALDAVGIDTVYAYGSPNNIKSSLLHRLSLKLTEKALEAYIGSGLEPSLFDELQEVGLTQLDVKQAFRELVYTTFTHSNLPLKFADNMNGEQRKDAVVDSLLSWHQAYQDLQTMLVALEYDYTAKQHIFNYPLTDEMYTKARLYKYGAHPNIVEELWKPYLIHGRLNLLPGYGYTVPSWLIEKDKKELGSITNTVQNEWHKNHRVLSQKLGAFLGAVIDSKAKLMGKKEFTLAKQNGEARLHYTLKLYHNQQTVTGNGIGTTITNEAVHKYVLTSTSLGYTTFLPNSIVDFFNTDLISFRHENLDYHDIKDDTPLFGEMNPNVADKCVWEDMDSMYWAYNYCKSGYTETGLSSATDKELLASIVTKHLIDNRDQLKTTTTAWDYAKGVMQAIVPVWATVEDFQKGNYAMGSLGLISDIGFFLPIGKAAFTTGKMTGKVISKALPRRYKVKSALNVLEIGSNKRVVGEAFDIDLKVARKQAKEAWLSLPKTVFDQMNVLPVTDIVKGAKSASLKIKQRVQKIKRKNTDPYAPKVYQSRDFRISSKDRPDFDPDKVVGIPSADRKAIASIADEENVVIGIRAVDPNNRSLLESGLYSSKSLLIKSKSSDWGPHAGFIPVDQKYAKASARAQVDRFNQYSDNAINSGAAVPVHLTIDDKRLKELQSGDNPLIPDLEYSSETGMYYGVSNGVELHYQKDDQGLWMVFVVENGNTTAPTPLMVMGNPISGKPMTADYDLFSVMTHISDYGAPDMFKMPEPWADWKKSIENPEKLDPKIKELFENEDLYNKVHNMQLGIISDRVIGLKDKINGRLGRSNGMELVHHGADDANPGAVINDNFPATYFVPKQYLNDDAFGPAQGGLRDFFQVDDNGAIILQNVDDFANFHQLMTNVHFTGALNTKWSENYAQLARKNRLSHAYLNAREQVDQLLFGNIDAAKIEFYRPKPFDETLPKGKIPAQKIEMYRVREQIINIEIATNGLHKATLKTYFGGQWLSRFIRVVRVGHYYYHVVTVDDERYLRTPAGDQLLRIEQDADGEWIAPDLPLD